MAARSTNCSGVEMGIPARRLVIVRHGKIPELGGCVVACITVKTCQPQCGSGTNLRGEHNIGTYVEVVKDLLVATTDEFLHGDTGRSGVSPREWITDVQHVSLLWEAHGEESEGPVLSFGTWSAAICG